MAMRTTVYVHFPWCAKRCPYCDFATRKIEARAIPHAAYADAVLSELDARRSAIEGRRLHAIFFGGGTPSLWEPAELGRVIAGVKEAFDVEADLEVTAECNPSSLDPERATAFAAAGVNRLSVGVQSLRDSRLQFLGRLHDREEALAAIAGARAAVSRVSADLMFGMPDQRSLAAEIDAVLATGVDHVSAYALTIESGTQFGELQRLGKLQVADDETYAALFEEAEARFATAGLEHYEVSNYARRGAESRHNLHYWRAGDYLGLGAAAVGCLLAEPGKARRYKNAIVGEDYLAGATEAESEDLDGEELIQEGLMLGLRTREGVELATLEARAGRALGRSRAIALARERGDLVVEDGWMRVPRERWLRLDGIVAALF